MNRPHVFLVLFILVLSAATPFAKADIIRPPSQPATGEVDFEQDFRAGVELYKSKKFADSAEAFQRSLDKDPENVASLTNRALAEYQAGRKSIAVALLRRANAMDPEFSVPLAGLKYILPQLEVKEIPHEIQLRESLRSQFLVPVPGPVYYFLTAFFLTASGWLLLGFWGKRRRARRRELPSPPFPVVGILFFFAFLFCLLLSIGKLIDQQIPRATIIQEKVSVLSAPDEKSVQLFDLYGGLEVIIENMKDDWVQVTYPGALSGWIPRNAAYPTSGKRLW